MDIKSILSKQFLLFDGAMGTRLQQLGLKANEIPDTYNLIHPELVAQIHQEYIAAGADIITTNTFGANEYKLKTTSFTVEDVIAAGVKLAKAAAGDKLVALDIGPIGELMEPMGDLSFERAYDVFAKAVKVGSAAGADVILIETMSDLYEVKAAVLAAKENCTLPVFCTMTFEQGGRTLMGADPQTMVNVLEGLGVDAIGINCSLGPKEVMPIADEILKYAAIPVMVQPNAGLPKVIGGEVDYEIAPESFAEYVLQMAEKGVSIFGGCCGTTPEYIQRVRHVLADRLPQKSAVHMKTAASSSRNTVVIGEGFTIIGERINPTGKEALSTALKAGDYDYVVTEVFDQQQEGAALIDVNVGLPDIDEKAVMVDVIKEIQSMCKIPLVIDSMRPEVLEAAARIYNGKPIINSVNAKRKVMDQVFPIVKKYGACVIAMTLDEAGLPKTAEERVQLAEKLIREAEAYGISKENIIIDCLALAAVAKQEDILESLKTVRMVKEKLGVATVLGISNVSYGLPNRNLLNRAFLAMAMGSGLDAGILNPSAKEMMDTAAACKVLVNQDKEMAQYLELYR